VCFKLYRHEHGMSQQMCRKVVAIREQCHLDQEELVSWSSQHLVDVGEGDPRQ
jgi:hypothetical protein